VARLYSSFSAMPLPVFGPDAMKFLHWYYTNLSIGCKAFDGRSPALRTVIIVTIISVLTRTWFFAIVPLYQSGNSNLLLQVLQNPWLLASILLMIFREFLLKPILSYRETFSMDRRSEQPSERSATDRSLLMLLRVSPLLSAVLFVVFATEFHSN